MQHLQQLANHRAQQERILNAAHEAKLTAAEKDFEDTARRLNEEHNAQGRALVLLPEHLALRVALADAAKAHLDNGNSAAAGGDGHVGGTLQVLELPAHLAEAVDLEDPAAAAHGVVLLDDLREAEQLVGLAEARLARL